MSIQKSNSIRLERKLVFDVKNSASDFNRFEAADLKTSIDAIKLIAVTQSYSGWLSVANVIFSAVGEIFPSEAFDAFCFMAGPHWKKDSPLSRYFGIGRALAKESGGRSLEFLFEEAIKNENDILFYGVVKLLDGNADEIFNLVSSNENGVIFVCKKGENHCFHEVISGLTDLLGDKDKTLDFRIDIVKAVQAILDKGAAALFPYAWEETGEYHLDIFLNETIRRQLKGPKGPD